MIKRFQNRIITASAGTGKTYRLSLEYIAIILRYYEHPDFKLDSILAITFTRKATAEIRQEILKHLTKLIESSDDTLITALKDIYTIEGEELSMREKNILLSARQEILVDQRNLQIMTIDSYTGNIFRNIVRPLRSIDEYDLDQNAVTKRMPFLLDHLMKREFRRRIDVLLSRKVQRSLDGYREMFEQLIDNRWLYFLIKTRAADASSAELYDPFSFEIACKGMFDLLDKARAAKAQEWSKILKAAFKRLFFALPEDKSMIVNEIVAQSNDSFRALKLFATLRKEEIYTKNSVKGTEGLADEAREHYERLLDALGTHIYHSFLLPEQQEICEVWKIILAEYDKLIYRYKNMTYSDITWFTFEALFSMTPPKYNLEDISEANEFYEFLTHRTRFMLIDEFQDTSLLQFRILKPIIEEVCSGIGSRDFGGVIVVGDQKQSIYGWRGGERELLTRLREVVPPLRDVESDSLKYSYRSTPDMMDFINAVFSSAHLHDHLAESGLKWKYGAVESRVDDASTAVSCSVFGYARNKSEKYASYKYFVQEIVLPRMQEEGAQDCAIICRKSNQLAAIQLLLEEEGKGGVFQPSARITEHRLVSPLYSWLRFVAYTDWIDLLSFLRSDYLLLSAPVLKEVIDAIALISGKEQVQAELPKELSFFLHLAQEHRDMSPYAILREVSQLCLKSIDDTSERDLLNLYQFQKIAADWEIQESERSLKITEFLSYIDSNIKDESFKQVSVEGGTQTQLLTIHKSKGLQFEKVFFFYDLDSSGSYFKELSWAIDYAEGGFDKIKDYILTYHYESILPYSPKKKLWERKQSLALLEELNNLYVAFTRAKKELHIFFSYPSAKPFDEYLADREAQDKIDLPICTINACLDALQEQELIATEGISQTQFIRKYKTTEHAPKEQPEPSASKPQPEGEQAAPTTGKLHVAAPHSIHWEHFKDKEHHHIPSHREAYVERMSSLRGTIIHDYLSYIRYDLEEEHREAQSFILRRYGSILRRDEIDRLFTELADEIKAHGDIFSTDYDMVLNEYAIDNYRIDRLMLDTKRKKAVVIDFKTGSVDEDSMQLEDYVALLKAKPAMAIYSIESHYIKIMQDG